MVNVSENFKTAMKEPIKEIQAFINYDEGSINDSDDLISFKVSCDSGLCKTAMRKLEATYLGNHNLIGKWVRVNFGVRLPEGKFEYLDYGSFLVSEQTVTKDTETTNIVAYDKMVNAMTPYQKLDVEYPIDLFTYTQKLCEVCGLELGNERNLWDVSKQKDLFNITYDNTTGIYTANDNDTREALYYLYRQIYNDGSYTTSLSPAITNTGIYSFTTTREENVKDIQLTNLASKYTFSIKFPMPDNIAVGETFTITFEVIDATVGASKFKNVMLYKGDSVVAYEPYNPMYDWQITATDTADGNFIDLWENIDGITYRDIFQQIAQATGSTCIIHDDKVYFKPLTDTGEELTYNNMFKLKLEDKYGEINSVVLSRTPIEGEDVFLRNEASIETNGLTEFKIENNEIVDKDRENAITHIFDLLYGISYYPFEATTEGLGWYEIGDNINIKNDAGEVFKTSLFNYVITVDGSVKETLKTTAESKTQTQYQYATTIAKQMQKNTEIIVNKQEQYIKSIVQEKEDGINERLTAIEQNIENINFNVQNSVGNNLIKNSVMFACDNENKPYNWTLEGDGTLIIATEIDAQRSGGISCHGFTLSNKTVKTDRIPVKRFDESNPLYYSFSTKLKTEYTSDCQVRIYGLGENNNEVDVHTLVLAENEATADSNGNIVFKEFSIDKIAPEVDFYIIEFSCLGDSEVTFTDNMFSIGEQPLQWSQANGEVMNTQVNVSVDGVMVRSSVYVGDYTIVSPLEFAGYSNINGTPTKVFTLNRGVTEVKELLAKDSIAMAPLKIIPVTEGAMQGWAIVLA